MPFYPLLHSPLAKSCWTDVLQSSAGRSDRTAYGDSLFRKSRNVACGNGLGLSFVECRHPKEAGSGMLNGLESLGGWSKSCRSCSIRFRDTQIFGMAKAALFPSSVERNLRLPQLHGETHGSGCAKGALIDDQEIADID